MSSALSVRSNAGVSEKPHNAATSLRRAARHEHARVSAERDRLRDRISQLRSEIEAVEGVEANLAEQLQLLEEVISADIGAAPKHDHVVLRGARLREQALIVLATRVGLREPVPYREWYRLLREAGFVVLAKRPIATFLTTVSRSPFIQRGDEPGTYYIEPSVIEKITQELAERRAELRDLESHLANRPPGASPLQRHRLNLMASVRRLERQVGEAERVLVAHRDSVLSSAPQAA
jgi:septal ring factor EnvC (AmiA/AmiB activator)